MAEQKNTVLEKNLINLLQNQLLPHLKAQKESENQAQRELENKLRALLKNKQLLKSLSEAQKNTLVKAANGCLPSMFDKLWTKVSTILNGLLQRTDKSPESVEKITEINRIIYHSLIHPNSNDLANIDVLVTTKGLKWQDDLDAVDNQFALLKLAATSKPVKRELVTTNKERITYKKREPTGPATATATATDTAANAKKNKV